MPHLKVNVNGTKYTISGITRGTCSKQILCALAKVDTELQARQTSARKSDSLKDARSSGCEEQSKRPRRVREARKKLKREDKCTTHKEAETKSREGKKSSSRNERLTKTSEELNNEGIQISSGMSEAVENITASQQSCLPTKRKQEDLKEEVLENCLPTVKDFDGSSGGRDTGLVTSKTANVEDRAKDTDHDTGISELHSDSSFEQNQILHTTEKSGVNESSEERTLNRTSHIEVKCASTNTDYMESAEITHACMPENETIDFQSQDFIVAELIGSETDLEMDNECTCVYVDSDTEELQEEIETMRNDLKLTESKLIEQNKMIEALNSLIDAGDVEEYCAQSEVTDDVNKRIDELKQSIKLSNQLYDYQKLETQANALELERVESQIRRKRWHVECLLKELHSIRNNSLTGGGQGRSVAYLREGTLV